MSRIAISDTITINIIMRITTSSSSSVSGDGRYILQIEKPKRNNNTIVSTISLFLSPFCGELSCKSLFSCFRLFEFIRIYGKTKRRRRGGRERLTGCRLKTKTQIMRPSAISAQRKHPRKY